MKNTKRNEQCMAGLNRIASLLNDDTISPQLHARP